MTVRGADQRAVLERDALSGTISRPGTPQASCAPGLARGVGDREADHPMPPLT
jgi:hypothetical protein